MDKNKDRLTDVEKSVEFVEKHTEKNTVCSKTESKNVDKNKKGNKKTVFILAILAIVISIGPLFALKGAEFGGSDDAGSKVVSEIKGKEYEPWFEPVMEKLIGGELPGEIESLLFCVQTGIGVGIVAYVFGYLVARKKYSSQK